MDAWPFGVPDRFPRAVDVLEARAREAGDDRAAYGLGDGLDGIEVTVGGDRETGLDHVDPEACELLGDLQLLGDVERDAGRLFAVSQGRVEDLDRFHVAAYFCTGLTGFGRFLPTKNPPARRHGGSSASTYVRSRLRKEEAEQR